ncbi:hypothetical protein BGZ95_008104 [Linnemannia exigua]|uniref:polynucleotide adenylyltransferase n=1 Tax=Linnemannia exigua TaxID=604196 RepID=A0AAD4H7I2_9FUNG|nr:hypothetical protein BGZ95_008104 [Linnemannia exigua]
MSSHRRNKGKNKHKEPAANKNNGIGNITEPGTINLHATEREEINTGTDSSSNNSNTTKRTDTTRNSAIDTGNNTASPKERKGAKRKREEWGDFEPLDNSDDNGSGGGQGLQAHHPWMRHHYASNRTAIQMLTQEINDFADYLKPTPEEHHIRTYVFKAVQEFVNSLWPEAQVYVFGSFHTKLYLLGSDMDVVVVLDGLKTVKLKTLARNIRTSGFGLNVEAIIHAKVPIVKFRDARTGIPVDISFNQQDGFKTGAVVQQFMKGMPVLQPMVMLIKQFLKSKPAMHPRIQARTIDPMENLGVLVIEFFELYGLCFNYNAVSISVTEGGSYIGKDGVMVPKQPLMLSLINPIAGQNVAKGTRNMPLIQTAFAAAYSDLTTAVFKRQLELDGNVERLQELSPSTAISQSTLLRQRSMIGKVFQVQEHMEMERERIHAIFKNGYFQQKFGFPDVEERLAEKEMEVSVKGVDHEMQLVGDGRESVEQEVALVGDGRGLIKAGDSILVRAVRRHFPLLNGLTTIQEFALSLKSKKTKARFSGKPGKLLDDTAFHSIQAEIRRLECEMSIARVARTNNPRTGSGGSNGSKGDVVNLVSPATWTKWSVRQEKLMNKITEDRIRTIALVRREAARLDQEANEEKDASKAKMKEENVTVSAKEQGACLQILSQLAISLFEELDPNDAQQVASFQPHLLELMEQQAQFGIREVESREGIELSPEDREQLVEWSNSAVADRLKLIDPLKMAKLEEELALLNNIRQNRSTAVAATTPTTTGSTVNSGVSTPSGDFDFFQELDSDEDGSDEPADKYFDEMMREAQEEYGSSDEDANSSNDTEATPSSTVGAYQDPQNINSEGSSIQLSQLYSSPRNDDGVGVAGSSRGNSSRHEQLSKMRKQV